MRTHRWVLLCAAILAGCAAAARGQEMLPDFENVPYDPYPLFPAAMQEPILTASSVTDDIAAFVADPFLLHEGDTWHLFFEFWSYTTGLGKIGHAVSADGTHWTYDRTAAATNFHLAFPHPFKYDGNYYMVVVPPDSNRVELYRAHAFPYDWRYDSTLLVGRPFSDTSVIRHAGIWWLFAGIEQTGYCVLYSSPNLHGPWVEHPMSPIINDPGASRPAGRLVCYDNGRVLRVAQKNDRWYGQAVRAFEVDVMTRTQYAEHEIPQSPVLWDSGVGWNKDGMHTYDAWWDGDHWLVSTDGRNDGSWSIGIYRSGTISGVGGGPAAGGAALSLDLRPNEPNPFRGSTTILYRVLGGDEGGPLRLGIYDAAGRLVRTLVDGSAEPGEHAITWDGADARGVGVPDGVYFCLLARDGRSVTTRMVRLP